MNYSAHLKATYAGRWRVCIVADNKKLVLQGEPLENKKDAEAVRKKLVKYGMKDGEELSAYHSFVRNARKG